MIRFACPGCGASYTVDDSKAGKTGRCPKCQSQFQIPAAGEGTSAPAGGSRPGPALPPADPNAPVEIAPCPGCDARLSVPAADVGAEVECPYCKSVYVARRPGPGTPPPRPAADAGRSDEEDEYDRPRRRSRHEDEYEDEEDEYDRPRRRSRYDEEEDEYDRPRRRRRRRPAPQSGLVSTIAICNYVLGGLCLLCTCLFVGVGAMVPEMQKKGKMPQNMQGIEGDVLAVIMFGLGGCNLLLALMLVLAGVGVSQRKNYGRILTFICAGLALLYTLYLIYNTLTLLGGGNAPGLCFSMLLTLMFGAYGVFALVAMIKGGEEFS